MGKRGTNQNRLWLTAAGGIGAMLLGIAGCAVGPNFHAPVTTMPAAWEGPATAPASQPATQPAVDLAQWWKSFQDPTLNALVERAIASNLDIKQAELRIRQAAGSRGVVASAFWPTVDVNASGQRSRTPAGGSKGITQNSFRAGLDAVWELDIFGGVRRNIEASEADLQAAVEDRRDVLVTLVSEVALNYTQLRGFQQQIVIAKRNLDAQKDTAQLTRKKFGAGLVGSLDVANADAQVATTEATIPTLEAGARQTIYNISVLLGRPPAELVKELSPDGPIPPSSPDVPVGLPSELLRRRPDIRKAEAQIHGATARIGVATADLFPKFTLTGSLGFEADKLAQMGNLNNRFWSFGPAMSWPLFDAGRISSNIEVQKALTEQSVLTYQQTVLTALQEVESAMISYDRERVRNASLIVAQEADRRAVDLATRLYKQGQTDFLNVLDAQRSLFATDAALIQSTQTLNTDLIALYKALGGGWESQEQPATAPAMTPATLPSTLPATQPTTAPATEPAKP